MSRIISKTVTVLEGKRIFALKICIQIDSVNLDYMWAGRLKKISVIFQQLPLKGYSKYTSLPTLLYSIKTHKKSFA